MEVGRGRGLGQGRLVADENLDGNIVGFRVDGAALGEHEQTAQAATAIEDLESAARLFHRRDEQVLEYAASFEIGGHLRYFQQVVGPPADLDGRKRKLRELNGRGHRRNSFWLPARSVERRVWKECVSTCKSRWSR